jgi:hypothetical protein
MEFMDIYSVFIVNINIMLKLIKIIFTIIFFMIKKIQVLSLMHKRAIVSAFMSAAALTTKKI